MALQTVFYHLGSLGKFQRKKNSAPKTCIAFLPQHLEHHWPFLQTPARDGGPKSKKRYSTHNYWEILALSKLAFDHPPNTRILAQSRIWRQKVRYLRQLIQCGQSSRTQVGGNNLDSSVDFFQNGLNPWTDRSQVHTCKKRGIAGIYPRKFFGFSAKF